MPHPVHYVSKNVPRLTCCNIDIHDPVTITIIFGRRITDKVGNQTMMLCFPIYSASALPCEIGNPEDSALVHCACTTVQLLQRSRLVLS